MVSVDFAKDGCDSVSPSTNIRRFRFRQKREDKSPPAEEIQDVEGARDQRRMALRLM